MAARVSTQALRSKWRAEWMTFNRAPSDDDLVLFIETCRSHRRDPSTSLGDVPRDLIVQLHPRIVALENELDEEDEEEEDEEEDDEDGDDEDGDDEDEEEEEEDGDDEDEEEDDEEEEEEEEEEEDEKPAKKPVSQHRARAKRNKTSTKLLALGDPVDADPLEGGAAETDATQSFVPPGPGPGPGPVSVSVSVPGPLSLSDPASSPASPVSPASSPLDETDIDVKSMSTSPPSPPAPISLPQDEKSIPNSMKPGNEDSKRPLSSSSSSLATTSSSGDKEQNQDQDLYILRSLASLEAQDRWFLQNTVPRALVMTTGSSLPAWVATVQRNLQTLLQTPHRERDLHGAMARVPAELWPLWEKDPMCVAAAADHRWLSVDRMASWTRTVTELGGPIPSPNSTSPTPQLAAGNENEKEKDKEKENDSSIPLASYVMAQRNRSDRSPPMQWPVPDDWVLASWLAFALRPLAETQQELARRLLIADAFIERVDRPTSERILLELKTQYERADASVSRECGQVDLLSTFGERLQQVRAFLARAGEESKSVRLPLLAPGPRCRWTMDGSPVPDDGIDSALAVRLWSLLIRCPDILSPSACDLRERTRILDKARAALQAPSKNDEAALVQLWNRLREEKNDKEHGKEKGSLKMYRVLWTVAVDTILLPASRAPTLSLDECARAIRALVSTVLPPTQWSRDTLRQLGNRALYGSPAILLTMTATPMPWDHDDRPPLEALRQRPAICFNVASPCARLAGMQWLWNYAWTRAIRLSFLEPRQK
jgi:hypothetical protein